MICPFAVKVISFAGSDCETEMLILTLYLKKYLKVSNTLQMPSKDKSSLVHQHFYNLFGSLSLQRLD